MTTLDDAIAAGDGTLHGAIDHWQERALKAEAERGPNELTRDAVAGLAKRAITLVNQPRPEALPSVGLDSLAASLADMRGRWVELIRHNGWGDQFDGDIQNVDDAIAFIESVPKGPCGDCPAQQSCAVHAALKDAK